VTNDPRDLRTTLPALSVCVPTRNGARWIEETLRSILAQDFRDFEVIIGDDASTDGTAEIAAGFDDPRIRIHRFDEWDGLGANWNRTLRLARGEFVALVCQDDLLSPQWASKLVDLLRKHPEADLAFGRRSFRFEDVTSVWLLDEFFKRRYPPILKSFYSRIGEVVPPDVMVREALAHLFEINLIGEPSFTIMRRAASPIQHGFDPGLRQMIDWEFFTRFFIDRPILHCPEVLGVFRLHAGGASVANSPLSRHYKEYEALLDLMPERFARYITDEQLHDLEARKVEVRRLWTKYQRSEQAADSVAGPVQQPIIVAGAHRSGTSLAASLLESAGVNVGDRLMEGNESNPRGHFEDMDFVVFHRMSLVTIGLHQDGWLLSEVPDLPDDLVALAGAILEQKRKSGRPWGWKDPRTVLLLSLWSSLVPEATYAIVYRSPWEVVDSLFTRGDVAFAEDPELAVRIWLHYNRKLIDLALARPERCVLANMDTIVANPSAWVAAVAERSGIPLQPPDTSLYEPTLRHGDRARRGADIIYYHYPEAVALFEALERHAFRPPGVEAPRPWTLESTTVEPDAHLAFQQWRESRQRERATAVPPS
jgi:glycosyltransferase involved in cell wall biosynthesis